VLVPFGGRYAEAPDVLRVLIWLLPASTVTSLLFRSLSAANRQATVTRIMAALTAVVVGGNWFVVARYGILGAAVVSLVTQVLGACLALMAFRRVAGHTRYTVRCAALLGGVLICTALVLGLPAAWAVPAALMVALAVSGIVLQSGVRAACAQLDALPPTGPESLDGQFEVVRSCAVCGTGRYRPLWRVLDTQLGTPDSFPLVQCDGCGLRYLRVRPTAQAAGHYYPSSYYAYLPLEPFRPSPVRWKQALWRATLACQHGYWHLLNGRAWLRRPGPIRALVTVATRMTWLRARGDRPIPDWVPGGRVLEVGCGNGRLLGRLQALGWETVGLDTSELACRRIAEQGHDWHCGPLETASFAPESFDAVAAHYVLEHVPDPSGLVQQMARLVEPGGVLQLSVPNAHSLNSRLLGRWWGPLDPPRHCWHFTAGLLVRMARGAGLRDVRWRTRGDGPNLVRSLRLLLRTAVTEEYRPTTAQPVSPAWLAAVAPLVALLDALRLGDNIELTGTKPAAPTVARSTRQQLQEVAG
jgi:SAM-dependent methyltransferase